MITANRGNADKMKQAQQKMASQVQTAKKGDEYFHLKEPNEEDMKKLGLI